VAERVHQIQIARYRGIVAETVGLLGETDWLVWSPFGF
jgi:hypothetical protein